VITLSLLTDLFITAWTLLSGYVGWRLGRRFPRPAPPGQTTCDDDHSVRHQASQELAQETRRRAVDAEKARLVLRRRSFWHRFAPFTLTITRRIP
jgi:hypothetical protein